MDSYVTVAGNTASVLHFARHFIFVAETLRQMFHLNCYPKLTLHPFSRQPKICLLQLHNTVYCIIFYLFWDISSSPGTLFALQRIFWSLRLLTQSVHIAITIHSQRYGRNFIFLDFVLGRSVQEFWEFRILIFNLYIPVHNSNDTFTNPLTPDNYTERLRLIFLKRTKRNLLSSVRNFCGFTVWIARYQTLRSQFSTKQCVYINCRHS